MRSYEEVIQRASVNMYYNYMDGGEARYGIMDSDVIAFIFDVSEEQVRNDAYAAYHEMLNGERSLI